MTVRELIQLLKKLPQDLPVITTMCSDYCDIDVDMISVVDGKKDYETNGRGLIRHHGHLMDLYKQWWPRGQDERPAEPEFVTAVHFDGN